MTLLVVSLRKYWLKNSYFLLKIAKTQHTRLRVGSDCGSKLPSLLLLVQIVTTILAEDAVEAIVALVVLCSNSKRLSANCHIKRIIARNGKRYPARASSNVLLTPSPVHRTDASARSPEGRVVVSSACRGVLRLSQSATPSGPQSLKGTAASAASAAASAAPARPVVPERSCGPGGYDGVAPYSCSTIRPVVAP